MRLARWKKSVLHNLYNLLGIQCQNVKKGEKRCLIRLCKRLQLPRRHHNADRPVASRAPNGQQDVGGRWARDRRTSKLNVWDDGHFARKDSVCYVTAARHLLEAPDDESEPTPQNPTLGVLAIFRDEAMYLTEWLKHYVAEGV